MQNCTWAETPYYTDRQKKHLSTYPFFRWRKAEGGPATAFGLAGEKIKKGGADSAFISPAERDWGFAVVKPRKLYMSARKLRRLESLTTD
jgi:hypothetical protein